MPELPEVETIVIELKQASLIGTKIEEAEVKWPRSIAGESKDVFCQKIKHRIFQDITRRGKFIIFHLDQGYLLVHLRMTGKFRIISKENVPAAAHERIRLNLSDGRILLFEDQRKFGKWYLVQDPTRALSGLGVEPLSSFFTIQFFNQLLAGHHKKIKPFLLDQHYIAGLGNIYVDEALWDAKIHPLRYSDSLTYEEVKALHHAIKKVLKKGIENTGTTLGSSSANYFSVSGRRGENQHQLKVFRKDGTPCSRCRTPIIKIVVGQRGTHVCPHCQTINQ